MSSITSASALILKGEFNDESRQYPIWRFLETCRDWFDAGEHNASGLEDFYTADFSLHTPHADEFESNAADHGYGEDHAFKRAAVKLYSDPLGEHKHENETLIATESSDGYEVYAQLVIYANVAGKPVEGETKIKDGKAKEWDVRIPVFYYFDCVKDSNAKHGFKIRHITTIKDTGLVNDKLDARGLGHKRSIN